MSHVARVDRLPEVDDGVIAFVVVVVAKASHALTPDAVARFQSGRRKLRTAPPNVAASAGPGGGQSGRHGFTALGS